MTTSSPLPDLTPTIDAALCLADPAAANAAITQAHYALGQALRALTGPNAGANFHAWAVWGSQKAGVTIRQEDLGAALRDATYASGTVGAFIGAAAAYTTLWAWPTPFPGLAFASLLLLGALLGAPLGALTGRAIARASRRAAARLVLDGNKLVLNDIGRHSARFLSTFPPGQPISPPALAAFLSPIDPTPSARGGQSLLRDAFTHYAYAANATASGDTDAAQQACYHANMRAILHEHIKLQPFIQGAMPYIIRRCVTQRMMTYDVGPLRLSISHDVPSLDALAPFPPSLQTLTDPALCDLITGPCGWPSVPSSPSGSAAQDWTILTQRMRYIANLFRALHLHPAVLEPPVLGPGQPAALGPGQPGAGAAR
jgi:hypothetical protein